MEWDDAQKQVLTLLHEGKSILLSGKAGSGKSTLLQAFCQGAMDTVICAPTGLAALNVGGTTIHSLFELPILHAAGGMDENNEEPLITRITCTLESG